jgi:hypothetical protein
MVSDLNVSVNVVAGPAKRALNETAKATDKVTESLGRAQKSANNMGDQFNKTGVKVNKFGKGVAQQFGYQIADFSVQLTGGTNALQAFGQQGSQMLAVFGPIGSLLGAAVAILAAVGVTAQKSGMFMLGAGEQSKKAAKSIEELGTSVSTLGGILDTSLSSSLKTLEEDFGGFNQNVIDATTNLRQLALETAQINLGKGATETLKAMSDLEDKSLKLQRVLRALREGSGVAPENELAGIKKLGLATKKQAEEFIEQQQRMGRAFAALRESVTVDQFTALGKELSTLAGLYPEQRSLLIGLANEALKMAKALAGPQVEAYKAASDSAKGYTDTLDKLRKEQAKALEEEGASIDAALQKIQLQTDQLGIQLDLFGKSKEAIKEQVDFLAMKAALIDKIGRQLLPKEISDIRKGLKLRREQAELLAKMTESIKADEARRKGHVNAEGKFHKERIKAQEKVNDLINSGFQTASNAIAGLISGTSTWRQALQSVLTKVIDIVFNMDKIGASGGGGGGGSIFGQLISGAASFLPSLFGPSLPPSAGPGPSGGIGGRFLHTGGTIGRGDVSLPGLRSDERMIIGQTGERVLSRGQTAQAGGGGVVVNQTINLSTGVQQTVRAEVMSLAPQIAAQAKAAVLDAKKRGGGFGAAFA